MQICLDIFQSIDIHPHFFTIFSKIAFHYSVHVFVFLDKMSSRGRKSAKKQETSDQSVAIVRSRILAFELDDENGSCIEWNHSTLCATVSEIRDLSAGKNRTRNTLVFFPSFPDSRCVEVTSKRGAAIRTRGN